MSASVEIGTFGFEVWDDFGPCGRRAVIGTGGEGTFGPLTFHGRRFAEQYAHARDRHAAHFAKYGYGENEFELRDECKRLARTYGRVF